MDRNSLFTVTIFMLAHTLGVSQSAATGRQTLVMSPSEAIGGESIPLQEEQKRRGEDDIDLPASYSSSAASSMESTVPDWVNNLRPDKDHWNNENDDVSNDEDEWGEVPVLSSPGAKLSYDQSGRRVDSGGPRNPEVVQHSPASSFSNNRVTMPTSEDLNTLRYLYHNNGLIDVGSSIMKPGEKLKRMYLARKLREQQATALPSARILKSNYRLPSDESITIRGNFDKRSPKCIANCMRQGLVHPIQCHSLCRKR